MNNSPHPGSANLSRESVLLCDSADRLDLWSSEIQFFQQRLGDGEVRGEKGLFVAVCSVAKTLGKFAEVLKTSLYCGGVDRGRG
jgi:hypothetical protein